MTEHQVYLQVLQKCGCFQVLNSILVLTPKIVSAFCLYFMAFGTYNPGWKCLDAVAGTESTTLPNDSVLYTGYNTTVINTNGTSSNNISSEYLFDSCDVFQACQNIHFNPVASTIVTEWGLICDRAWITSFIISVMMAGLPVGTFLSGFFGDRFGRKWTYYFSILILGAVSLISMFSTSWQMFAALRFCMGVLSGIILYLPQVLTSEFVPASWRPVIQGAPVWNVGMLMFCICAMTTQDWYTIHMIMAALAFGLFLPCVWVPESLRWLLANGKQEKAFSVAKKVAKLNKVDLPYENMIEMLDNGQAQKNEDKTETYTFIDLFKRRFKFTLVLGCSFLTMDMIYFATNFGVAVYPGNVYVNMIIMSATELPSNVISSFLPNLTGRRKLSVTTFFICSLFMTGVALTDLFASDDARIYGIMSLLSLSKVFLNTTWYTMTIQTIELYPTVLRSTALGYIGGMAGIGSIIAPYLIPSTEDGLYINYFIMGSCLLVCGFLVLLLPETKGKPLTDTWDEAEKEYEV